jgi:hypothetical protein
MTPLFADCRSSLAKLLFWSSIQDDGCCDHRLQSTNLLPIFNTLPSVPASVGISKRSHLCEVQLANAAPSRLQTGPIPLEMAASKTQAAAAKPWRPLKVETDEELEELLAQPGIKGGTAETQAETQQPVACVRLEEHLRPACAMYGRHADKSLS